VLDDGAEVFDGYYDVKLILHVNVVEFIRLHGD
jgi:hypothetical protein